MAFFAGMVEMANRPHRRRRDPELEAARRRDRERDRQEAWGARSKYYERCEMESAKFEEFTSPRYYAENNRMLEERRSARKRDEQLEARRAKLRQLFLDDDRMYKLEAYMARCTPRAQRADDVPIELLRAANEERKADEEAARRRRADEALHAQWRRDSPRMRDARRNCQLEKVKMSWLHQQLEKRDRKERERSEARAQLEAVAAAVEAARVEEAACVAEAERKRAALRADLDAQTADLRRREEDARELDAREAAARSAAEELHTLQAEWEAGEKRRRADVVAVANERYAKRRLELRAHAAGVQRDEERRLVERLQAAALVDEVRDAERRAHLQNAMRAFLAKLEQLRVVEERTRALYASSLLFDSEAALTLAQREDAWRMEEEQRKRLLAEILRGLRDQIDGNVERARGEQRELAAERDAMREKAARAEADLEDVRKWEAGKKAALRKDLDEQVAAKRQREVDLQRLERDAHVTDELAQLADEEARLKNEIAQMQRGESVPTHGRRRFFY